MCVGLGIKISTHDHLSDLPMDGEAVMNNFLTSNTNSESTLQSKKHTYFKGESCGSTIIIVIKLQTGQ